MRKILAFEQEPKKEIINLINSLHSDLLKYGKVLIENYELKEKPNGVVYTSTKIATEVLSDVPIPAYTRNNAIILGVELEDWKDIFKNQCGIHYSEVYKTYYDNNLYQELLGILCHELTHHIDLFPSEFDDYTDDIWFEEGMCFYIPRKTILDPREYEEIYSIERSLISNFYDRYGHNSLLRFGSSSYEESIESIMFDYWRSFIVIDYYVNNIFGGDQWALIKAYRLWYEDQDKPIETYLKITPDMVLKLLFEE